MSFFYVLVFYVLIFFGTILFFYKSQGKSIFASSLAGIICSQLILVLMSFFGVFGETKDQNSTSAELIFWAINLLTPFVVYFSLLYVIATKNL